MCCCAVHSTEYEDLDYISTKNTCCRLSAILGCQLCMFRMDAILDFAPIPGLVQGSHAGFPPTSVPISSLGAGYMCVYQRYEAGQSIPRDLSLPLLKRFQCRLLQADICFILNTKTKKNYRRVQFNNMLNYLPGTVVVAGLDFPGLDWVLQ
jgi:hypothetical protein